MTRVALLALTFLAACDVGEVPINGQGGDGGPPPGGDGSGSSAPLCSTRNPNPPPVHLHTTGSGTDNNGQSCIAAGCHLAGQLGGGAPAFDLAGTVYKSGTTTGDPGVQILVLDSGGNNVLTGDGIVTSDAGGNFYLYAGGAPGLAAAYPAHTKVSVCPGADGVMSETIAPSATANMNGPNCNGCHAKTGGSTLPLTTPAP